MDEKPISEEVREVLTKLFWTAHERGVQKVMPTEQITIERTQEAILAIFKKRLPKEKKEGQYLDGNSYISASGFNQCLAEIRKVLE